MPCLPFFTSQCTLTSGNNLNTENIQNWQDPLQELHLLLNSCFTCKVWHYHGTSALLEPKQRFCQSRPLCAFFILPVNTSASTEPPYCSWWAYCTVVLCNATLQRTRFLIIPKVPPLFLLPPPPLLFLHGSKALI